MAIAEFVVKSDGIDYLVMEYLEDETLADRLKKGPVPLDQVLEYAIEIADALDKAHRQGITHRDLKPGNIILTKSATKPVDFGETAARCSTRPPSQLPAANEGIKASPRRARFWARCNTWHRSKWGQDSGQRDLRNHVVRSAADVVASAYDAAGVRPCGQEMLGQGSRETMASGQRHLRRLEMDCRRWIAGHVRSGWRR